jgi:hypothetical protein
MPYHIPDEDRLSDAIFSVMYRNQQIRSQSEFTRLVRKELEKDGKEYKVSEERARLIAIRRNLANITIDYHESDDSGMPDECPVCRNPMTAVMNMTLDGGSRELRRKCTVCPYTVGSKRRIPGRYTFTRPRK